MKFFGVAIANVLARGLWLWRRYTAGCGSTVCAGGRLRGSRVHEGDAKEDGKQDGDAAKKPDLPADTGFIFSKMLFERKSVCLLGARSGSNFFVQAHEGITVNIEVVVVFGLDNAMVVGIQFAANSGKRKL